MSACRPVSLRIHPDLDGRVPAPVSMAAIAADIVVDASPKPLLDLLDRVTRDTGVLYADMRPQDQPAIAATRAAYKALGKDPGRYRPAAEALARRVAQGKGLGPINTIVDINNVLSLETGLSIGSYDRASIGDEVVLRAAGAGESYAGIGRGPLNLEGLPVLADESGPFGSPTSDSERSMVTGDCCWVLLVIFDFGSGLLDDAVVARASALLAEHAGARHIAHQWIGRNRA